ncbi:hypothetical protein MOUN0_K02894 [Monosporozyma unispora]
MKECVGKRKKTFYKRYSNLGKVSVSKKRISTVVIFLWCLNITYLLNYGYLTKK